MDQKLENSILKTGTLTLGIVCKDGIVVAADRRVSFGAHGGGVSYIAGKHKKIFNLNDDIIVTTAGVVSDSRKFISFVKAELKLLELRSKERPSIRKAANLLGNMLYQAIRRPSMIPSMVHFLLAGHDSNGNHLYDLTADGVIHEVEDYSATGAGFMQAHPILDSEYSKDMTTKEGVELAVKCIKASLNREPSVGDGFDVYVVKNGKVEEVLTKEITPEYKDNKKE